MSEGSLTASRIERAHNRAGRRDDAPIGIVIFVICVAALLYLAWSRRGSGIINPEHGIGYALGIAGGVMMLALLLYPLRKRMRAMRQAGSVAAWFRLHMILGVIGPVLVIIHSNFETQSLNAAVALYSMLIVSISGIVGRYIYGRIHRGLYGGKLEAREFIADAREFRKTLGLGEESGVWNAMLADLERDASAQPRGLLSAITLATRINTNASRSERALREEVDRRLSERGLRLGWSQRETRDVIADSRRRIGQYHQVVRRVGDLAIYDRLFAAWHILHLPLFLMLILTAMIHVVAVHLY